MVQLTVRIEGDELLQQMRNGPKAVRWAAANALNDTAKYAQGKERQQVRRVFTVRQRTERFVMRQAAHLPKPWARDTSLAVTLQVKPADRLLLGKFEGGDPKQPQPGRRSIAVPITGGPARPSFGQSVPRRLYVESLGLRREGRRKVGRKRTYAIPSVGIFQQQQGGQRPLLLYMFKPRARLDRRLHFVDTARAAVRARFHRLFEAEVDRAIVYRFKRYGPKAFSAD